MRFVCALCERNMCRHLAHIGWDPEHGFDAQNIDPSWQELFSELGKYGITQEHLKDKETAQFVVSFVNARGGPKKRAAPPPPSKGNDTSAMSVHRSRRSKENGTSTTAPKKAKRRHCS